MHELAICQALLDEIGAQAAAHSPARVASVTVELGPLSGVVPELFRQAYEFAKVGSVAGNATLLIKATEVRVYCSECESETAARPNRLVCGVCGNWRTRLRAGDELLLRAIEFDRDDGTQRPESRAALG
jgi:hydrogenase nickel incorporation protein HypA/HybF